MFCENCGASVPDGVKFCRNCGAPVVLRAAPAPMPPAPAAPAPVAPAQPAFAPQAPAQAATPPLGWAPQPQAYAPQPYPPQVAPQAYAPTYAQPGGYMRRPRSGMEMAADMVTFLALIVMIVSIAVGGDFILIGVSVLLLIVAAVLFFLDRSQKRQAQMAAMYQAGAPPQYQPPYQPPAHP